VKFQPIPFISFGDTNLIARKAKCDCHAYALASTKAFLIVKIIELKNVYNAYNVDCWQLQNQSM
jgi:hypothetical protein